MQRQSFSKLQWMVNFKTWRISPLISQVTKRVPSSIQILIATIKKWPLHLSIQHQKQDESV